MTDGRTRLVIELPPLSRDQAAMIAEIFEQVVAQIWDRHGEQLDELAARDRDAARITRGDSDLPF
jgi:hypothetical protein